MVAAVAWVSRDLPDPNNINSRVVAQSTKIYARDGKTVLYEVHGDQRRTVVELSDISPYVKPATLSIEDKDFYRHGGVSLRGIIRALWVDLVAGRKVQGGSTITQQLVKNSILTNEKSFTRKFKELILAYQLERRFTKDQILKLYFNEIPYGSSAYGIEAAAQIYFGQSAKDLDLAAGALLAALVKAPTYYSPSGNHRPELLQRQRYVLDRMVADRYITREQAEAAKAVDILARVSKSRDRITAPHFVFYVRDLLVQKYGEVLVERGGLRVVTTLDPELQGIAEDEIKKGVEKNETRYHATNAALVAVDPKTGQILAMVGSRDYFDTDHDGNFNVATAVRNPGSSFKPVVYLTAFTKRYTPNTVLYDLKTDFGPDGSGKNFSPNNYDGREHGPLRMRQTLAGSLNIPAVKTLYLAGIPSTLDLAERLGYTTFDRSKLGLALAIGGGGVKLLEHVGAFSVLANGGQRNQLVPILRVEDRNGRVLEQFQKKEVRVVEAQPVRQLVDVMSDNNARAFIFGLRNSLTLAGRPVAAKTGTTNDFRDAWTVGFTPQLAAGVWRGNNDYSPMRGGADGVVVAAPIWHAFMERALTKKPVERFTKPAPIKTDKPVLAGTLPTETTVFVDAVTRKKIPDDCLATWPKQYIATQKIKAVHTILYYVDRTNPTGPAPTDPSSDPMFARWEKPVQAWAKKNGFVSKVPANEDCGLRANASGPTLRVLEPKPNITITTSPLTVSVDVASPNAIISVQYIIDGLTVATVTTAPFGAQLDISQIENGFHTLRVQATDGTGNSSSVDVAVNIVANSSSTVYFLSPEASATVNATDFPLAVNAFAQDADGVATATLFMRDASGTDTVLDALSAPSTANLSFSWPTTAPGKYRLYIVVKSKRGRTTQSDLLPVTVR